MHSCVDASHWPRPTSFRENQMTAAGLERLGKVKWCPTFKTVVELLYSRFVGSADAHICKEMSLFQCSYKMELEQGCS